MTINKVTSVETSEAFEVLAIQHCNRDYDGKPKGDPTMAIDMPTGGAIQITLANGDVIVAWTSEWGGLEYHRKHGNDR
jgi:hypothetical protein